MINNHTDKSVSLLAPRCIRIRSSYPQFQRGHHPWLILTQLSAIICAVELAHYVYP